MATKKLIPAVPEVREFRLCDIVPAAYNPRRISDSAMEGLSHSLAKFGCVEPIIVNTRGDKNIIVGGHQRHAALKKLHGPDTKFPCIVVDLDKEDEEMLNLTLNNPHIQGQFIKGLDKYLKQVRESLTDAQPFLDLQIDKLTKELVTPKGKVPDDQIPDLEGETITQLGDIWQLGDHRLLCGDCTDRKAVARLMGKTKADMVFTDPPYRVSYSEKNKALNESDGGHRLESKIQNDSMTEEEYKVFSGSFASLIKKYCDGCVYVCGDQHKDGRILFTELDKRFHPSTTIIWVKDQFTLGRGKYHNRYEPIWFGWNKNGSTFVDDRTLSNVWNYKKPKSSKLHPTMKPVELISNAILHASQMKDIVLDLFLGSGSTLIACEKLQRKCYGMEIEPVYCDVIVKRWEEWTGKKAKRVKAK